MTLEQSSRAIPAETPPLSSAEIAPQPGVASAALRLQILATEHWSLLATRSMAWNEVFSRAGMYLTTLSGAIVALALVGQGSGFDRPFALFALVLLPVVIFVGEMTIVRMGAANTNDAICVVGMNRIRAGYLEMAPELERFFVMSAHDDTVGVGVTMGVTDGPMPVLHIFAATPSVIGTVNGVVVGAFVATVGLVLNADTAAAALAGILGFGVAMVGHGAYGRRQIMRGQASLRPIFPTPSRTAVD